MPTARETLLEAARTAVVAQPWTGVRMVDVAADAGVSRQTLYNEFGSKEGLGAALVGRLVEDFVDGAAGAAADAGRNGADAAACCVAAAAWMLRTARDEPIVHAALTGRWDVRMPLPAPLRRTAAPEFLWEPGRLAGVLRDRTVASLAPDPALAPSGQAPGGAVSLPELGRACEAGLRLALSYVVAPEDRLGEDPCRRVGEVVRALLARR